MRTSRDVLLFVLLVGVAVAYFWLPAGWLKLLCGLVVPVVFCRSLWNLYQQRWLNCVNRVLMIAAIGGLFTLDSVSAVLGWDLEALRWVSRAALIGCFLLMMACWQRRRPELRLPRERAES